MFESRDDDNERRCYCGGVIYKKDFNKDFEALTCDKCGEIYIIIEKKKKN